MLSNNYPEWFENDADVVLGRSKNFLLINSHGVMNIHLTMQVSCVNLVTTLIHSLIFCIHL